MKDDRIGPPDTCNIIYYLTLRRETRDFVLKQATAFQYKKRCSSKIFIDNQQGHDGGLVSDLPTRYTIFQRRTKTRSSSNQAAESSWQPNLSSRMPLTSVPSHRNVRSRSLQRLSTVFFRRLGLSSSLKLVLHKSPQRMSLQAEVRSAMLGRRKSRTI